MNPAARVRQPWRHWDDLALRRSIGVYVHVPYCLKRCRYCDFLSFGAKHPAGFGPPEYAALLREEAERRGAWAARWYGPAGRRATTLFIGGGTPTCLGGELLCNVLSAARGAFAIEDGAEVTVEANPETLTRGLLAALAEAGVNRLSVGVQAAQDRHLRFLGRTHRLEVVRRALELVRQGPVRRVSYDLIYAVPGLTAAELRSTLRLLLACRPEHLSAYELTIEPGTPLAAAARSHPRMLVPPDRAAGQQRLIERTLADHGLYRYEVSNYARPGAECRHNLRYWRGGDYLGLGLGAASRVGTEVVNNPRTPEEYRAHVARAGGPEDPLVQAAEAPARSTGAALPVAGPLAPPADDFLQLRTRAGLAYPKHAPDRSVAAASAARPRIDRRWIMRGWVRCAAQALEVTPRGLDFAELLARGLD